MENHPPQLPPEVTENSKVATQPRFKNTPVLVASLILIALVVFGVAAFLLLRRSQLADIFKRSPADLTTAAPAQEADILPSTPPVAVDTSTWATYTDPQAGFSFKYPKSVLINSDSENTTQLSLSVAVEKLSDIPEELPMMMGRDSALQQKARLARGEGEGLIKIGSLNADTAYTYSQFEVCSVMFVRKLIFYPEEYRVMLTLSAPSEKMMADMPAFFHTDPANCGPQMIWNREIDADFETTLANKKGLGLAQSWYDTFYGMAGTVQLIIPAVSSTSSPSLVNLIAPASGTVYKNETYGFQLTYDKPYKLLTDKDNLYGYPKGVALLYTGGQAYDIVIEIWDTQAAYEKEYEFRLKDVTVLKSKGKFITVLNNNPTAANKQIIDSVKALP